MASLLEDLKKQLSGQLIRKASISCSRWAENYVVLGKPKPGPQGFIWHPWEREIMDCDDDWSAEKAAQMGLTHVALCRGIFTNDIHRTDVLYLLPKRSPDATDFSKAKFDALLDTSPDLQNLYSSIRNVGHKQAGAVNFFIRGTRSRTGLKTISAGLQVWDELDEMPRKQMALAKERSSGYEEEDTQLIKISTPTVPDFGIDLEVKRTDRSLFVFKCPRCGKWTHFVFPDCLVEGTDNLQDEKALHQSHIICYECKGRLEHQSKKDFLGLHNGAHWEPQFKGFATRGFVGLSQLYSMVVQPWQIVETKLKGEHDPSELQEYWNSKGGLPHIPEGARINDSDFLYGTHSIADPPPRNALLTMGVDVGKVLHYWIDQWALPEILGSDLNMFAKARCIKFGIVKDFESLDGIMRDYQVVHAIIDYQPEERKAQEFCIRMLGHAHRCYPNKGAKGKMMNINESEQIVGVNRVAWLDVSQGRFKSKKILLPRDTTDEVRKHLKNIVRLVKKEASSLENKETEVGQVIAKYIKLGPDHYAFARYYSEIALPLAVSAAQNKDVTAFL